MKQFTLLMLLAYMSNVNGQTIQRQLLRDLFIRATEHKSALDSLAVKLESLPKKSPAEESYLGICNGLYCQYDDGNWAKLKHVMKSKNHLNTAVERDARDPELRFLRLMLEHFLPSFLGLNKHISEDLNIIFSNPGFIDDNLPLKKKVMEFLLWSKRCTPEQNRLLEQQLAELNKKLNPAVAKPATSEK